MPQIQGIYGVMNILGFVGRAEPQIGLGKRLEQPDLVHVMWAFIDMGDVYGPDVCPCGKIRTTSFELGSSQAPQGIYKRGIQTILAVFDDVHRGLKILLRCDVLAGAVLNDGEISERFGRIGRHRAIDANLQFDDTFCDVLCLVEHVGRHQLFVPREFPGEQFFGCRAGVRRRILFDRALIGDRNNLIERTFVVIAAIFLSTRSCGLAQENDSDVFI